MVILGVLLLLLGAAVILAALFTAEVAGGDLQLLGVDVAPPAPFLFGVGAAAAIALGWWILKVGVKREWRQRREQKHYEELSEKLDDADRNRDRDLDRDDPDRRSF
jgi:hypothetical protein